MQRQVHSWVRSRALRRMCLSLVNARTNRQRRHSPRLPEFRTAKSLTGVSGQAGNLPDTVDVLRAFVFPSSGGPPSGRTDTGLTAYADPQDA